MVIKSELLELWSWRFWNFLFSMRLSNGEYFKNFKIFDLTWIWWIWLEWPVIKGGVDTMNTVLISASKSLLTIFMQCKSLRDNTSFICNRWFQFKQLIWDKKPCQIMSSSTDTYIGRMGFVDGQCWMLGSYLHPCIGLHDTGY